MRVCKAKKKNTCVSGYPTDPKKIDRNCRPKTFYLHVWPKFGDLGLKWPKNRGFGLSRKIVVFSRFFFAKS